MIPSHVIRRYTVIYYYQVAGIFHQNALQLLPSSTASSFLISIILLARRKWFISSNCASHAPIGMENIRICIFKSTGKAGIYSIVYVMVLPKAHPSPLL